MPPIDRANEDPFLAVPAKTLPLPHADVSPGARALIAKPLNLDWNLRWSTAEEARAYAERRAAETLRMLPAMRERLKVTSAAATIDGVRVHILTPETIRPENLDKVLIHLHGGCYVLSPGEAGTVEGLIMASAGHVQGRLG